MLRKLEINDILWLVEHGVKEAGMTANTTEHMRALAQQRVEQGTGITGIVNGKIVGCAGIDILWEGVGEAWCLLSMETDKFPIKTFLTIKDGLAWLIEDNNLRRVQAFGDVGFHRAHTLFKHLGFKPEGIARKYLPNGNDAILYAKVI